MNDNYKKMECVICSGEYYIPKPGSNYRQRNGVNVRPRRSLTCSKKCSKEKSIWDQLNYYRKHGKKRAKNE